MNAQIDYAQEERIRGAAMEMYQALLKINEWCSYATQHHASGRLLALQQIGALAGPALDKAEGRS